MSFITSSTLIPKVTVATLVPSGKAQDYQKVWSFLSGTEVISLAERGSVFLGNVLTEVGDGKVSGPAQVNTGTKPAQFDWSLRAKD